MMKNPVPELGVVIYVPLMFHFHVKNAEGKHPFTTWLDHGEILAILPTFVYNINKIIFAAILLLSTLIFQSE